MQSKITIRQGHSTRTVLEDVLADSAGLRKICDTELRPGQVNIVLTCEGLEDEAKINFVAMWQKSTKHMKFILGLPSGVPVQRSQIWRKYFRNKVDIEHGQGRGFDEFIIHYLETYLQGITYSNGSFSVTGIFTSSHAVAAAVGRMVNMLRWCEHWTQSIKLVSEAGMTWATFNKVTLDCEQPIVRRRK